LACTTAQAAGAAASAPTNGGEAPRTVHALKWGDKLKDAGATGMVQLALSVFGAGFVFERLFRLRQKYLAPRGLAEHARRLWDEGRFDELEKLKDTRPSTLARVISFIVLNRQLPLQEASQVSADLISRELGVQYQKAYPLGIVATLAPLLGLLGMILGMIETFETVSTAGALGDPSQLASGISEALVTTGLGLAVAIPFLALYHFFKYRTAGFGVELEGQVTDLLTAWLIKKSDAQPTRTEEKAPCA
jgi:biopolymer transport protein ExbB